MVGQFRRICTGPPGKVWQNVHRLETRQWVVDADKAQGGEVIEDDEGCSHTYLGSGLGAEGAVDIVYRKTAHVANIF